MIAHSVAAFQNHAAITSIYLVIGSGQIALAEQALAGLKSPQYVSGGATRRESVRAGLQKIASDGGADLVLIHDAARPFLPQNVISQLIDALDSYEGAVPALPIVDSIASGKDMMTATVDRENLNRIQTPQAFHFEPIYQAHISWDIQDEPTDDARMLMHFGKSVALVAGDETLNKITFAADFAKFNGANEHMIFRAGQGYDVHRLVAGEELWLCGTKIDHSHGLLGHSDADVALHALTDAILGAAALGDIGDHFPPSDPQWRGAASDQFVKHAMTLAAQKGFALVNADITIICEAPKISPHKSAMRSKVASILDVDIDQISVKATTTEMLGFAGRGEGIAAQASVTLSKMDAVSL